MKSSAVLNSRQKRTVGSTSHFGSSKAVSGSSAILVGGSSCVFMATPSADAANHTALQRASLLDHLVGAGEQTIWHGKAERLGGFQIDRQLVFGRRLHWQIGRLLALEDAVDIASCLTVLIDLIRPVGDEAASGGEDWII